jgi:nucleoside-diphosphate-sugar epimerase
MPASMGSEPTSSVPWKNLAKRRILLTGGTGFFGCTLLEAYTKAWEGERLGGLITVLTRNAAAFRVKAPKLAGHPGVDVIEGKLNEINFGNRSWDTVVHAAVEYGEPLEILERNQTNTKIILELARRWNSKRVLFTSSGAVYGPQPPEMAHITEDYLGFPVISKYDSYGQEKRNSELLGMLHGERYGYDFLIARCFAFMGPWLPLGGSGAAGNFIGDALAGRPILVRGNGRPLRSYLFGEDLADWLWTVLLRGVHGRPYNVGSSEAVSIADLAYRVRDILAPEGEVRISMDAEQGPRLRYVPSVERAQQELGLKMRIGLNEAILRTGNWNRNQPASLGNADVEAPPSRRVD